MRGLVEITRSPWKLFILCHPPVSRTVVSPPPPEPPTANETLLGNLTAIMKFALARGLLRSSYERVTIGHSVKVMDPGVAQFLNDP